MKKLIQLSMLLFSIMTFAQSSTAKIGSVSGKVIDAATKEGVPYATIAIETKTKEIVTGGISAEDGSFTVKGIPAGEFVVRIQFIGYKEHSQNIIITKKKKAVNIGTVAIAEDATQLNEVEVIAERSTIEQKIDRKVINVGKDLISAGASASEIMNNIPSVNVDQQTGAIALRGNENVRVLVDGKPTNIDPAQLLQQIPSASIKQIELITNPSAKYNPEGMSGIINIVLHKNSNQGFNGTFTSGVTFAETPKVNTSLNLNYKVNKVNVYANYGLNHGKRVNRGFINSQQTNRTNRQDFFFGNYNTSHLLKTGIDYYINDKNTLSFYTNQNIFDSRGFGWTNVTFFPSPANLESVYQDNNSDTDSHAQTYNLDYKLDFGKEGQNIELEINYNTTDAPQDATFNFMYPNNQLNAASRNNLRHDIVGNKRENTIINLDYVNPLSETAKLEIGLESRIQNTTNSLYSTIYGITPQGPNPSITSFDYDRNIHSGYVTYSKQWKKFSAQIGARLEQYDVDATFVDNGTAGTFNDEIFSVYPSAFFTYKASDKNSYNISYSRRVDRPGIGQVNPIREWTTPQIESIGNPNLRPQFTNSFEFNYTRRIKIGSITMGTFYRKINDEITRIVTVTPSQQDPDILSFKNFENNDAFGFEASANLRFTKWWAVNASLDLYNKTVKGTVFDEMGLPEFVEVDVTTVNGRINNSFKASNKLRFQLFGFYRGRDLGLQFEREAMWRADLGASYNFMKRKGTLSVRVSDIFNTMHFGFDGSKPFAQQGQFHWESRSVYLGVTYRFGGGKNRALQRKQRDDNEKQGGGGMF